MEVRFELVGWERGWVSTGKGEWSCLNHLFPVHFFPFLPTPTIGQAQVNRRYAKSNHSFLPKHDPDKSFKITEYDDINQAYAYCMDMPIPYNLRWTTKEEHEWICREITEYQLANMNRSDQKGFIVEVTLSYPNSAKKRFRNFPALPVKSAICQKNISLHTKELIDRFELGSDLGTKLISDLHDHKVALHIEYLQCLLLIGLQVKTIHRTCIFDQSPWMHNFIAHHVELRRMAKNEYQKSFHKLVLNSQFGK